jgi:outer membrane protein TolC
MKKVKIIIAILLILKTVIATPQDTIHLTLDQVIETANKNSLDAFRAKNMYLARYWEYKSFRAKQLPSLDLNLTPLDFRRTMTKRYDYEQDIDVYREQKTMDNYARLSLSQNLPVIGGEVYIDTDLSRLVNYGDEDLTTFSATWLRIGISQPLFGFNELKWEKRISPLKFEMAKKEYLQTQQETKIKAVELYFNLLMASVKKEIAINNYATSDTLYQLGTKKKEILAISREELLNLELNKFNAEIEIVKARQEEEKALFNLNSFLGFENDSLITTSIPPVANDISFNPDNAIEIAKNNNPSILEIEQKKLEADKTLDKAIKESRFSASLVASYGLNQYAEKLPDAYKNPLDQQIVVIGLQIPILDWGESRGKRQMARKNQETIYIEAKQLLSDFEQAVVLKTLDFNLQPKLVQSAKRADEIAKLSYELTKKKFMLGKADVLRMNEAMKAWQSAHENYLNSISTYWKYYYELQKLTLYDLKNKTNLEEDFDEMIEKN